MYFHLLTAISTSELSRKTSLHLQNESRIRVNVCVHGGKVSLSHLWGSVKVALQFNQTDVHSYEAER